MASTNQSTGSRHSESQTPTDRLADILNQPLNVEEDDVSDSRFEDVDDEVLSQDSDSISFVPRTSRMIDPREMPQIPALFTHPPEIRDSLETKSSREQDKTVSEILPWLNGTAQLHNPLFEPNIHGIQHLDRESHILFLHNQLGRFPSGAVFADASRPWFLYWALTGLSVLGEDISQYKERVIATIAPMQNASGGFGAGHGHLSHCAASYAAVLSLVIVGGDEALSLIDRKSMWRWLARLKQPDGGFTVCVNGEEDVRGAYCVLTIISLLGLPLNLPKDTSSVGSHETFVSGLPEWLSRCQTYEGGIAASPDNEAHGGYAFCALGALSIMGPPHLMIPKYMDLPALIRWLSARQYAPEGGYSGRSNKLVDGCYSWWVGGCWPLIESALNGPRANDGKADTKLPVVGLYSRDGLIRYILSCCQEPSGGMRDKPSTHPDGYHTCYVLAGLSSAQHTYYYSNQNFVEHWTDRSDAEQHIASSRSQGEQTDSNVPVENVGLESSEPFPLSHAFCWAGFRGAAKSGTLESLVKVFGQEDQVGLIHPVFVVPWSAAERARVWFHSQAGF